MLPWLLTFFWTLAITFFTGTDCAFKFGIPYSGKFSLGSYFRDFADWIRSRENKNRNNLFQQKFKGRFTWNRENKNRKNYFTHFYLKIAKIFVRENFPLYGICFLCSFFPMVAYTLNMWLPLWTLTYSCKASTLAPLTYTIPCGPFLTLAVFLLCFKICANIFFMTSHCQIKIYYIRKLKKLNIVARS